MQTRCEVLVAEQQRLADCGGQHDAMKFQAEITPRLEAAAGLP